MAKIYLVGGAVRDQLLGRPVKDRDYVVVGSTPEEMLSQGFEQVGADFPVFLHPETKEEYALARSERKTGHGYNGFEVTFDSSTTLEQDLIRRDLTINAIAQDIDTGEIIDPFGGVSDLNRRLLRHTSVAFAEDPLRVVRLARFFARYEALGFTVDFETIDLAQRVVASGELGFLSKERLWLELEKAFGDGNPDAFFKMLEMFDVFNKVPFFKDIAPHCGLANAWAGAFDDSKLALDVFLSWTSRKGSDLFDQRPRAKKLSELANVVADWWSLDSNITVASRLVKVFEMARAFNTPELFLTYLKSVKVWDAIMKVQQTDKMSATFIEKAFEVAKSVKSTDFPELTGRDLGEAMRTARIQAVLSSIEQ